MFDMVYNIAFYIFVLLALTFLGFGIVIFDSLLLMIGMLFALACVLMALETKA